MLMNVTHQERLWKLLVYGASGTGKTTLGVSAPKPLILLGERQGWEAVRDAAILHKKKVPPTFYLRSMEELRIAIGVLSGGGPRVIERLIDTLAKNALTKALLSENAITEPDLAKRKERMKEGRWMSLEEIAEARSTYSEENVAAMKKSLPYSEPQTIVADSMTEFLTMIGDDVDATAKVEKGKDGLEHRSMRAFGVVKTRGERFIRSLRDLPYHVLFLARLEDKEIGDEKQKERVVQPLTPQRTFPETIMAACNAAGIMESVQVTVPGEKPDDEPVRATKHGVSFSEPTFKRTKALRPLRDRETCNVSGWIRRLNATSAERDASTEDTSDSNESTGTAG